MNYTSFRLMALVKGLETAIESVTPEQRTIMVTNESKIFNLPKNSYV